MINYKDFIDKKLAEPIRKYGVLKVGINLNDYFNFEDANLYYENFIKINKKNSSDSPRQIKSSKDSILGKLVEETLIYLLDKYFKQNKFTYIVTNNANLDKTTKYINDTLRIERSKSGHIKKFDSDIIIYDKNNFEQTKKTFILSVKGITRERIGQFLSHLFLMDKDVLNAKYGKNKYEVIFEKEKIILKYAFVTMDWAKNKDFIKYTKQGKIRKTIKETEIQLIIDDVKIGGGIYVLNNLENLDGIGNFATLCGAICDFLK